MSKRSKIPAPFRRLLPSVIRTYGPRIFAVFGVSAVLLYCGGCYLVSQVTSVSPKPPVAMPLPVTSVQAAAPAQEIVVDPPTTPTASVSVTPTSSGQSLASPTVATPFLNSASPVCSAPCIGTNSSPSLVLQPVADMVHTPLSQPLKNILQQALPFKTHP